MVVGAEVGEEFVGVGVGADEEGEDVEGGNGVGVVAQAADGGKEGLVGGVEFAVGEEEEGIGGLGEGGAVAGGEVGGAAAGVVTLKEADGVEFVFGAGEGGFGLEEDGFFGEEDDVEFGAAIEGGDEFAEFTHGEVDSAGATDGLVHAAGFVEDEDDGVAGGAGFEGGFGAEGGVVEGVEAGFEDVELTGVANKGMARCGIGGVPGGERRGEVVRGRSDGGGEVESFRGGGECGGIGGGDFRTGGGRGCLGRPEVEAQKGNGVKCRGSDEDAPKDGSVHLLKE